MSERSKDEPQGQLVEIGSVSAITPHNKALYEAGKVMLVNSISISMEFCKYMVSLSTGAIPIYLALLKFALPEEYTFSFQQGAIAILPPVLLLAATILFALGCYPQAGSFSLDVPAEIERERDRAIKVRAKTTLAGFILFTLGCLASVVSVLTFMGL
jgi:hypothetical protein